MWPLKGSQVQSWPYPMAQETLGEAEGEWDQLEMSADFEERFSMEMSAVSVG